ncbi:thiol-disulfide isomerase/thioredoxin [Bradyrhizobium sp. I1.8.5]
MMLGTASLAPSLKVENWLRGKLRKLYIVEFRASWCDPCEEAMPHLIELQAKYKDEGLEIVGVAANEKAPTADEARAKLDAWLTEKFSNLNYRIGFDSTGAMDKLWMNASSSLGIPRSFVVDRDGHIAFIGDPMDIDDVLPKICSGQSAIGSPSPHRGFSRRTMMRRLVNAALGCGLCLLPVVPATAQSTPNPAMNSPDQLAWQFFIQVNTLAGGNNALFETWASDTDTFNPNPQFPTAPAPLALRRPVVPNLGRLAQQRAGKLLQAIPPGVGEGVLEETRRNKDAFDFIVQNNLYKLSGLRAAFGKTLSFPVAAMEVKANWKLVSEIPAFTGGRVTLADVPKFYHVNTGADGQQYAFLSMHIISKAVPNWTWATFEHKFNPARCDITGCHDSFGAQTNPVNPQPGQGYPDCVKTPALAAIIASADWDPAFANYCLKGTQADFVDSTGLDIRAGNSVTEQGFVDQSSCMTCHGRAAWDNTGAATTGGGFDNNGAPLGPIQPNWFWSFSAQPPIFQGMPGLTQVATSADFVWSVPFCAIDDTQNPPQPSKCAGK